MKPLFLAALFLAFTPLVATATAADEVQTLPLGAVAPSFELPGVDGKTHRLSDYAGAKALAVVFTCNHCPTAQAYEERLKALVDDYRKKGVAFVMISPNDPEAIRPDELGFTDLSDSLAEMKVRAQDRKFNFPYLFGDGPHEQVSQSYGPKATPHAFLFDQERKLRYSGRIDDAERMKFVKKRDLRDAIEAVLAGKAVSVPSNKAFGCSTKWSSKRAEVKAYWDKIAQEPVKLTAVKVEDMKALRSNKGSGKTRLVNFWATWCGPCITEFPDLMQIHRQYGGRDLELVTVAAQYPDEEAQVLAFLKKQRASAVNFLFSDTDKYALMEAFDKKWEGALPFTMLIDPKGKVLYQKQGPVDVLALKRIIVKALDQQKRG